MTHNYLETDHGQEILLINVQSVNIVSRCPRYQTPYRQGHGCYQVPHETVECVFEPAEGLVCMATIRLNGFDLFRWTLLTMRSHINATQPCACQQMDNKFYETVRIPKAYHVLCLYRYQIESLTEHSHPPPNLQVHGRISHMFPLQIFPDKKQWLQ